MIEAIGWMLIGAFFGLLPYIANALLIFLESKEKTNG